MLRATLLLVALVSFAPASQGAESWDSAVKRLCSSLSQEDCWIKSGAAICDREQAVCRNLPDHTPAIILGRSGNRWHVKTAGGEGWVNQRWMMLDGSKMN